MIRPLLAVSKVEDDASFCDLCANPALFIVAPALLDAENKLCATCALTYTLQFLKREGADLSDVQTAFVRLSMAADAPLATSLLQ